MRLKFGNGRPVDYQVAKLEAPPIGAGCCEFLYEFAVVGEDYTLTLDIYTRISDFDLCRLTAFLIARDGKVLYLDGNWKERQI
jgi:hypothetical protein